MYTISLDCNMKVKSVHVAVRSAEGGRREFYVNYRSENRGHVDPERLSFVRLEFLPPDLPIPPGERGMGIDNITIMPQSYFCGKHRLVLSVSPPYMHFAPKLFKRVLFAIGQT